MDAGLDTVDEVREAALAAELRVLIGQLRRRLLEQGRVGDLPPSQTAVLLRLDRDGPATVTGLARAEGVRPQSMGATVAALEAAGLVTGAADPQDGRQTILSISAACRAQVSAKRAAREDWLARVIRSHFSAAERAELERAVALLTRLAGAAMPASPERDRPWA